MIGLINRTIAAGSGSRLCSMELEILISVNLTLHLRSRQVLCSVDISGAAHCDEPNPKPAPHPSPQYAPFPTQETPRPPHHHPKSDTHGATDKRRFAAVCTRAAPDRGVATNRHSAALYGCQIIFRICDAPSSDISPALSGGLAMPGACGLLTGLGHLNGGCADFAAVRSTVANGGFCSKT